MSKSQLICKFQLVTRLPQKLAEILKENNGHEKFKAVKTNCFPIMIICICYVNYTIKHYMQSFLQ